MILEIILLISSVTRASILDHVLLSDGSKYYPTNSCAFYGFNVSINFIIYKLSLKQNPRPGFVVLHFTLVSQNLKNF